MKARTAALTLALCFLGAVVCFAQSPFMGSWTLNEAKSKFSPSSGKITKAVWETVGEDVKLTTDGVDAAGNPTHTEWTGKLDGRYYPISGNPLAETMSLTRSGSRTIVIRQRKGKKLMLSGRIVVSADGKTRTVTVHGTDSSGKKFHSMAVYDKE